MKRNQAFTLIELLVVIAIIAVLMGILMPSLSKVRKQARGVVCRVNIKSLQTGTMMYIEDNNNKTMEYGHLSDTNYGLWTLSIAPYTGEMDDARYCPVTKKVKLGTGLPNTFQAWGTAMKAWAWDTDLTKNHSDNKDIEQGSFAFNGWLYSNRSDRDARDQAANYKSINDAKHPALTPLFADAKWVDVWPRISDNCPAKLDLDGDSDIAGNSMPRMLINRHGDYVNLGFVDGHQEPVDLNMLWNLKWHKNFKMRGPVARIDGKPITP